MHRTKNDNRAWRANVALNAYVERIAGADEPTEDVIIDFLTDLRHLCDRLDVDFDRAVDWANTNHLAETKDEEK